MHPTHMPVSTSRTPLVSGTVIGRGAKVDVRLPSTPVAVLLIVLERLLEVLVRFVLVELSPDVSVELTEPREELTELMSALRLFALLVKSASALLCAHNEVAVEATTALATAIPQTVIHCLLVIFTIFCSSDILS